MKLRVNCAGMVGFLSNGIFVNWAIDVQHRANGRSGDGPDIIVEEVAGDVGDPGIDVVVDGTPRSPPIEPHLKKKIRPTTPPHD